MERIKQAIENAKKPGASRSGRPEMSHVHSQYTRSSNEDHVHHAVRWDIVKNVSGVVLIILAGWLWMRLDFMNQLELIASEYINDGIKNARAEVQRRQSDEVKFKQLIQSNLEHCQDAAVRDNEKYMNLAQEAVTRKNDKGSPNKQEEFIIPKAAVIAAAKMLETAKAECQQIYNTQLKSGK